MDLTDKLEQFSSIPYGFKVMSDDELFERSMDFIMNLDPEQLNDNQLDSVIGIMDDLEIDVDELGEVKLAKKTSSQDRMKAKAYRRKNKAKMKLKKKKFQKSSEGRKRKKKAAIMGKSGKTATGRKKLKYH